MTTKTHAFHSSSLRKIHLGNLGMLWMVVVRLRCLQGKVTSPLHVFVGSAQCSGCMIYGPSAMAAILPV